MLWYKSWLETRWRFVIGLVLLMFTACSTVLLYPELTKLLPLVPKVDLEGELGRQVKEAMELSSSYRGYVWSQWFAKNMRQMLLVFAVLLGTGGLLSQMSGGGTLFTLSLPASRNRLAGVRAATGLAELLVLAIVPPLMLPILSPLIGEGYGIVDALVFSVCLYIGATVFYSLTFLLSTIFSDVWRPLLIALCVAAVLAFLEQISRDVSRFGLFTMMSAEDYFRGGGLPWLGLLTSAALSLALIAGAARNIARQDF